MNVFLIGLISGTAFVAASDLLARALGYRNILDGLRETHIEEHGNAPEQAALYGILFWGFLLASCAATVGVYVFRVLTQ